MRKSEEKGLIPKSCLLPILRLTSFSIDSMQSKVKKGPPYRECRKKVKYPPSGNCRAAHLSIFSIAPFKRFSKDFQKICPRPPPGRGSANRGDILHQEIQFCFQKLHFTESTYLLTRHLEVKGQY